MPRNVRNFWIEAEVDGRKTPIAFGPQGADGGFRLTICMRNKGEVEEVAQIEGADIGDKRLGLRIAAVGRQYIRVNRQR